MGQRSSLAENLSDRAERRVWTPAVVEDQSSSIRPLGPARDAVSTALAAALLEIAELALGDRHAAERLVAEVLQREGALVAAATRSPAPAERRAAETELARAVRRAALDALPPVVASPRPAPASGGQSVKAPQARKTRPAKSPAESKPAARAKAEAAAAAEPERRVRPARAQRRRGVAVLAALAVLALAGVAAWFVVLDPAAEVSSPPAELAADASAPAEGLPEALQLEAVEPAGGPLRELDRGESAGPSPEGPAPTRIIPMEAAPAGPVPATDSGALPGGGGNLRVFILYPEGDAAAAEAGALYAALSRAGGLPLVVLRDVGFAVASPRIRYFHSADAEAAQAIADLAGSEGGWTLQDFSHIRPLPAPGTIEVYVPSNP